MLALVICCTRTFSLDPNPILEEGKGSSDFGPFAWFDRLCADTGERKQSLNVIGQ